MKLKIFFVLYFICFLTLSAQQKMIAVEDVYRGLFYEKTLGKFYSLQNGKEYIVLKSNELNRSSLAAYDYETFQETRILVDYSDFSDFQFSKYIFDKEENKILLGGDLDMIYRRSTRGKYFVFDLNSKERKLVFDKKIQEPLFSPDGNKVAFSFNNNLYYKKLDTDEVVQITFDGKENEIINGISDWVYEEEFAIVRMFDWSKDGKKIAFVRFDEREVPEFSMDVYGKNLYPYQSVFKYPKAGENNSKVNVFVYDIVEKKLEKIEIESYYIPKLQWTNDDNILCIHTLNRYQNDFKMLYFDIKNKKTSVVYSEKDQAYVDVNMQKMQLLSDNSFFITSERDGFNHIYHYDKKGKLVRKITNGNWEVTDFYGYDEKSKTIYYQSTERGSINRDVFLISDKGTNKKLLSSKEGKNNASFNADFSYFINQHENSTTPKSFTVYRTKGLKEIKRIIDNEQLKSLVDAYSKSRKEFKTININGNDLNMWILKPQDFDSSKKYPVLMYQYSGPGSQSVQNEWFDVNDYWYLSLTQKGYIVICVDGRGTGYKGANFKKITQLQLGKYETEDQIKVAEYMGTLPYVDASRIGIWGWSFGGFTSSNCILKGNHIFKMAIAVAPVTNWSFYDTIYTERYMKTPNENPRGYQENSPLNFAENLKGKYLLIHGTADDNVHVQNAMRMVEELVQKNKKFEWAIYPDKDHGIYGGYTRIHLYEKMTDFILNNL